MDTRRSPSVPAGIWILGLVSMFMDISSELVHSLLPIWMTSVLGASVMTVGILEGVAEAAAAITKVLSGSISDYAGKRKPLAMIGYGLSALTKPFFPLATTIGWVFAARFTDRIGKGIRGAPRDALVAELVSEETRGAAYGLRQALDSAGALLGPLLALALMLLFANDIRAVLWIAVVPAAVSVILLATGVREPGSERKTVGPKNRLLLAGAGRLPASYWLVAGFGFILTLARFSEAFLILRAEDAGLSPGNIPLIMIVMNVTYTLFAYPAGRAADLFPPRVLLVSGTLVLVLSDAVLAAAVTPATVLAGAGLLGVHMAMTQGLLSKLVADNAPDDLRGTAFGIFNLTSGVALLLSSTIAGALWSSAGASATFIAGAVFAAVAAAGLFCCRKKSIH